MSLAFDLNRERVARYEILESCRILFNRLGIQDSFKGLCKCSRVPWGSSVSFEYSPDNCSCRIVGLVHCGLSYCVVCALPCQIKRRNMIQAGILSARKKHGLGVYLVTYTFSHGCGDSLKDIQERFSMAKQFMYRNGSFRRLLADLGYVGRITDYEIQVCGKNGFHPHTHDLEFMSPGLDLERLQYEYSGYYLDALERFGLSGRSDVAVNVQGYEGVGKYISKMSAELTLGNFNKDSWGGGSMSPFQCLKLFHDTGEMYYGAWFADYCVKVKGKRILGWSRGLKTLLGVEQVADQSRAVPLIVLDDPKDYQKRSPAEWRSVVDCINGRKWLMAEEILKRWGIGFYISPSGFEVYSNSEKV